MSSLCRPTEIRIPNDPAFGPAAAGYVVEVARLVGFTEPDLHAIDQAILTAITALIQYSFEPGEQGEVIVSCEHVPEGLKVTLQDKGLPFGPAEISTQGSVCAEKGSEFCARILGLRGDFEEVRLHSMGMEGKQTVLVKHLKNRTVEEYQTTCDLPTEKEPVHVPARPKWTVRQVMPEEAPEISRLVYKSYGYTYSHDYVYYPERIVALNEVGRVHSAVAIADGKEIAGHCTLQFPEDNPRIAELAQAVVKPEYRSRGCLRAMTDYLIRVAEDKGMRGVFTKSVTEHPFSQRTAHRFGFKDCAVLLGFIPQNTPFKGLTDSLRHRGSLLVQFRYLQSASGARCFAPSRHREMIAKICENLGIAAEIRADRVSTVPSKGGSILKTQALALMQFARMVIERSGSDVIDRVETELRELRMQNFEIIHLYLNLGDPETVRLTAEFEELGFFFAGILPEAFPDGHGLILQLLNNPAVDYDAVVAETRIAREMIAYIRAQDPNHP